MVMRFTARLLVAICSLISLFVLPAQAGVVLETTRVIYPAQEREISVPVINDNKNLPVLVQVWVDDGNKKSAPDQIKAPFLVAPPMFRMEPGKGQSLRITYLRDEPLPTNKETVFWLNLLEVPPKAKTVKAEANNTLQLAFRTRVKLFFRPKDLKGNVADAPSQLRWKVLHEGDQPLLEAENPSAYYVSFERVSLVADGKEMKTEDPQMIEPGGTQRFVLSGTPLPVGAKTHVQFTSIDDRGLIASHTAVPTP